MGKSHCKECKLLNAHLMMANTPPKQEEDAVDQTELAKRMIAIADKNNLPEDHELRVKGIAFTEACKGYFENPQTISVSQFMGAWARARKCWSVYTGESLL